MMNTDSLIQLFQPKPSPLLLRIIAGGSWLLVALYSGVAWFGGASGAWVAVVVLSITALGMFTGRFLFPASLEGIKKYTFVASHLFLAGACGWFLFQNLSS